MKINNETAAICGLFCVSCPCYPNLCHGCLSNKLTSHCVHCPNGFRSCAKVHNVTRCFECAEFPCERLEKFSSEHWENGIGHHVSVIKDLQFMKDFGVDSWISKKSEEATCSKCGEIIKWMDVNSHLCK